MSDSLIFLAASLIVNICMFVPAAIFKTDKLTDVSYAATFIVLSIYAFVQSDQQPLHVMLFVAIVLWSVRLGSFLFLRIRRIGKDKRFDAMRDKPLVFIRFWLLQGVTVFAVMYASILAFATDSSVIHWVSVLGFVIFASGLALESVADAQKSSFSANPKNKDKWIDSGVWRISRHPNYFGEMLVWFGLYIAVFPTLSDSDRIAGFFSPLFIAVLLIFVSGIPILEKAAMKKWGHNNAYKKYVLDVPVLVPTLASVKRIISKQ